MPVTPRLQLKILVRLLLGASAVMLLGFSVSNWQPSAKAPDSTPKLARLHYSLPLPEPIISLEIDIKQAAEEIDAPLWESVIIKSGDSLATIFSKKGISASTTHQIARLNEQTKTLRYIQPGEEIQLLLDEQRNLRQSQQQSCAYRND